MKSSTTKQNNSIGNLLEDLSEKVGYHFKTSYLLELALTVPNTKESSKEWNRMEFLGDKILGFLVAKKLFAKHKSHAVATLVPNYNYLVCRTYLANVGEQINLEEIIKINYQSQVTTKLLSDMCEAFIGALFLDGGLDACEAFIEKYWSQEITNPPNTKDAKSLLQELAHSKNISPPTYQVMLEAGLDHEKTFDIKVQLSNNLEAQASGSSKKEAEIKAAEKLLKLFYENSS